jgi:sugar phosphate isomerase/epimerase
MLFGAMNFPVRPVLEELGKISGMGFDYMELSMDPPEAHHSTIRRQAGELLDALDRLKMGLICHLPCFVNPADLTESIRTASIAETLDSLKLAADLGAEKVVLHPGYISGLAVFVMGRARRFAMDGLRAVVDTGGELGITICLENMFPQARFLVKPADFEPVFGSFPSLRMTLDTGHAHIGDKEGKRAVEFIRRYAERIEHVHMSDNFGKEDNHIPVGTGTVDFQSIVHELRSMGYSRTITIEVFSRDREYLRISRDKLAGMFQFPLPKSI